GKIAPLSCPSAPPASPRLIGLQTQSYEVVRRFPLIPQKLPYPELRLKHEISIKADLHNKLNMLNKKPRKSVAFLFITITRESGVAAQA
ncbi:MAG TPA: hypothetical protein VF427_06850, partial [Noviherbaspirillum sp.]